MNTSACTTSFHHCAGDSRQFNAGFNASNMENRTMKCLNYFGRTLTQDSKTRTLKNDTPGLGVSEDGEKWRTSLESCVGEW